jgi:hypothetical protein
MSAWRRACSARSTVIRSAICPVTVLQPGQRGQADQVRSGRGNTVYCCHRPA